MPRWLLLLGALGLSACARSTPPVASTSPKTAPPAAKAPEEPAAPVRSLDLDPATESPEHPTEPAPAPVAQPDYGDAAGKHVRIPVGATMYVGAPGGRTVVLRPPPNANANAKGTPTVTSVVMVVTKVDGRWLEVAPTGHTLGDSLGLGVLGATGTVLVADAETLTPTLAEPHEVRRGKKRVRLEVGSQVHINGDEASVYASGKTYRVPAESIVTARWFSPEIDVASAKKRKPKKKPSAGGTLPGGTSLRWSTGQLLGALKGDLALPKPIARRYGKRCIPLPLAEPNSTGRDASVALSACFDAEPITDRKMRRKLEAEMDLEVLRVLSGSGPADAGILSDSGGDNAALDAAIEGGAQR